MEECHLHNGIDAGTEFAFTGNLRRIDNVYLGLTLMQQRLHIFRQVMPDLIGAVRRIDEENAAWFQTFDHLVFFNELPLMAANEISLAN